MDNGTEWYGEFKEELINSGTKVEYTLPYCPEQNGQQERTNKTIKDGLKLFISEKSNFNEEEFDKELARLVTVYNESHIHSALGMTIKKFKEINNEIKKVDTNVLSNNQIGEIISKQSFAIQPLSTSKKEKPRMLKNQEIKEEKNKISLLMISY